MQGSQVRNLHRPPQSKILKTFNALGSFPDFISKIYAYASLGSIFFVLLFIDSYKEHS
jgi:hypothetical protein